MRRKEFNIDVYDWSVEVLQAEDKTDAGSIEKFMRDFDIDDADIEMISDAIKDGQKDGGWLYYNTGTKKSMIIVYPVSSGNVLTNILCHEKRHLEDNIIENLGIKDREAVAYLAGYLGEKLLCFSFD